MESKILKILLKKREMAYTFHNVLLSIRKRSYEPIADVVIAVSGWTYSRKIYQYRNVDRNIIDLKLGKITKKKNMEKCPDISKVTVERTLTALVKTGYISKTGAGPSTAYVKNNN